MTSLARHFVGIDLHKQVVQVCVLNDQGTVAEESRFPVGNPASNGKLLDYLFGWGAGGRFAVEAIGLNRWFVNACLAEGMDILVVDPVKLNLKILGKKTDRNDAREIARRLYLGDIDQYARSYYPTDHEYGIRKLLRTRHSLVSLRQHVVNQVRGLLNAYQVPLAGRLISARNLARLRSDLLPTESLNLVLETQATLLEAIGTAIDTLAVQIGRQVAEEAPVKAWTEIPEVGPVTALTLRYELGPLERFDRSREVASYVGLVPRLNHSGEHVHQGRLTKRGNRELRWVLGQWAVRLLIRNGPARAWAAARMTSRGVHKNKVRMALARRLLVGLFAAERRGEPFSLEKCLGH